jgi:hypothetical protein
MQAMKSLMLKIVAAVAVSGTLSLVPVAVFAAQPGDTANHACSIVRGQGQTLPGCTSGTNLSGNNGYLMVFVNTLIWAGGLLALIFLLVGGSRYLTSTGDPQRIQQAKNTVLYSIVGLVVVLLAQAIISFVIAKVPGS